MLNGNQICKLMVLIHLSVPMVDFSIYIDRLEYHICLSEKYDAVGNRRVQIPASRPSLYWNPNAKTDVENESFTFSVNLPKSTKSTFLKIEGMSIDGIPFFRVFQILVK